MGKQDIMKQALKAQKELDRIDAKEAKKIEKAKADAALERIEIYDSIDEDVSALLKNVSIA